MDLFEDALQLVEDSPPACSLVVVDDDVNDGAEPLSQNNGCDGSQPSTQKCKDVVRSRAKSDKRASPLGKLPKITAVKEEATDGVICIYVGIAKKRKPVPMWPQYTVDWNGYNFGSGRFIVVSNLEAWMLSVVASTTVYSSGQKARKVAKASMERVRREWEGYLQQARKPLEQDEMAASPAEKIYKRKVDSRGEVNVKIGGHSVFCLNDARKMVMRADRATMKCIEEWMVPIIVHQSRMIDESLAASPEDVVSTAGFQFVGNPTPNIRDKVAWYPSLHAWVINLKNPGRAAETKTFVLDHSLFPSEYEAKKIELYSEAISAWNEHDGSTRHRIPVSTLSTPGSQ